MVSIPKISATAADIFYGAMCKLAGISTATQQRMVFVENSTCQLRTGPPFDIGTPKVPELADLHTANLAVSCHALQRLGMNPQDRCGLITIQHPFCTPFDAWDSAVR
jgi:hypothetical protein